MKKLNWNLRLGLSLLAISALGYILQITLFHREGDTFFYMLQDLAFLPVQILLVSLILNDLISRREKSDMQKKMNMVIGVFFSEVGTELLKRLADFDMKLSDLRDIAAVNTNWKDSDFVKTAKYLQNADFEIDEKPRDLSELRGFLIENRAFMLTLLENPNLLEHETFTDLLWAVSHVAEELGFRGNVTTIAGPDYTHLMGDIKRAYVILIIEWLSYVKHLKDNYPYMFSLVVRTSPFDPDASAEIK